MRRLLLLVLVLTAFSLPAATASAAPQDDAPTTTPIKHLVMLMQDNHSFDNYFGTYPGADGIPAGVCQRLSLTRTSTKGCVKPFHLGTAPADDLGQSIGIQKRQYNNGKMDGFVAAYRWLGRDGSASMGYYDGTDIPSYWNAADENVLFDRFFSSTAVGSRESYLYWLAGNAPSSDKALTSAAGYDKLPTIFDRLDQKGVSAKFYVENLDQRVTDPSNTKLARSSQLVKVPLLSMKRFQDGGPLAGRVVDLSEYYTDLRNGTLPAVSYVVSSGSSENPPSRVDVGQRLVRNLSNELARSRYWDSSAFMWTYDGWGGWYDHVAPPKVDAHGYGFRVPALLISSYAKRGVVDHTRLDYTSMLKFIESNWQVKPLATRDASANNLMSAFDFAAGPRPAALISSARSSVAEPAVNPGRARPVIYTMYGAALTAVVALLALAFVVKRPPNDLPPATVTAPFRPRLRPDSKERFADEVPDEWETRHGSWREQRVASGQVSSGNVGADEDWADWYAASIQVNEVEEPGDPRADWYAEGGRPKGKHGARAHKKKGT